MEKILDLLKANRSQFLAAKEVVTCNILLCFLGIEHDYHTQKSLRERESQPNYFPREMMSKAEKQMIIIQRAPSYAIAGVTFIGGGMFYFATTRIRGKQMSPKPNYDHMYYNTEIRVFQEEEQFVEFLSKSDDFVGEGIGCEELHTEIKARIKETSVIYCEFQKQEMKYSIKNGILIID